MSNHKTKPALLVGASLLTAVLAAGCAKEAEKVERSTNPNVPVATLFTHDGCTIYRFYDGGLDHYFARCGTKAETITRHNLGCGKGCVRTWDENIRTDGR